VDERNVTTSGQRTRHAHHVGLGHPGIDEPLRELVLEEVDLALTRQIARQAHDLLPLKRKLARLAVYSLLPLLLYGRVGWNSQSAVFSPVQKVRSMVDADRDASTLWRDLENFNLISTYADNPVLGSGFGHLAVGVPDVYATCEKLAKAGVKIPRPAGPMAHGGSVIAFIEDPDGYKIELVERK